MRRETKDFPAPKKWYCAHSYSGVSHWEVRHPVNIPILPQSKRKGLSFEEKRTKLLEIFHETVRFFPTVNARILTWHPWRRLYKPTHHRRINNWTIMNFLSLPQQTFYQLKDLEKIAPKTKGIGVIFPSIHLFWKPMKLKNTSYVYILYKERWIYREFSLCSAVTQSVKEVLQSVVDDGLVDTEKIGTSIYFWSFPTKFFRKVITETQ